MECVDRSARISLRRIVLYNRGNRYLLEGIGGNSREKKDDSSGLIRTDGETKYKKRTNCQYRIVGGDDSG